MTNDYVTWSSSNETIAIVDQTGKVTGISKGSVLIFLTANNDETISATLHLTVNEQQAVMEINSEAGSMPLNYLIMICIQ